MYVYKYLRYTFVLIIYFLIKIIGKLYNYLIINLRHKARYSVYGFIYEHNLFFFRPEALHCTRHVNSFRFVLWFIGVWIWLDDNTSKDCLPDKELVNIAKDNITYFNIVSKELSRHKSIPFSITSSKPTSFLYKKLSIDYQVDNNFKHFFFYTIDKDITFYKKIGNYRLGYESIDKIINGKMVYKLVFKKV